MWHRHQANEAGGSPSSRSKAWLAAGILCLPLLSPGAQAAEPAPAKNLPLEVTEDGAYASVMVDGKGPFKFIVDTGTADAVVISPSLAQKLHLSPSGTAPNTNGVTKQVTQLPVYDIDVDYAGLKRTHVPATALEFGEQDEDGIIGFAFFKGHLFTLDLSARRIRLETGALPQANGQDILDFTSPYGVPTIDATVGGEHSRFDIDTGQANLLMLSKATADKLKFAKPPVEAGKMRSGQAEFVVEAGRLDGVLRIGKFEFTDPTAIFSAAFDGGNLGFDLFKKYLLTFDQANKRLRLQPVPPPSR